MCEVKKCLLHHPGTATIFNCRINQDWGKLKSSLVEGKIMGPKTHQCKFISKTFINT